MFYAIETEGITKRFGGVAAVSDVSISIEQGELLGLLGPNGAGKTTLINMLSTMTEPSGGSARVWGFDVVADAHRVRQSIGVVFQDITLDERLTGRENLDIHGRLYGLEGRVRRERVEEVLALVDLTDRADTLVKTYSGGMLRRLQIARGFVHKPHILFLDEPTLGLDPQTRIHIWEYIKTLTEEEGVTIVLTTHYLEEADHLCNRVAIIDRGKIVVIDTPEALKSQLGGDVITLEVEGAADIARLRALYESNGFARVVTRGSTGVSMAVRDGERNIPHVLNLASRAGILVLSVSLHKPALDDVFLHHTGRALRDRETGDAEEYGRSRTRPMRR
ncbi:MULTISPECIES: ATP-binding cassette domain-containing protein [unclassified Methanoculleus]|uniref:ATP-binding cassette domain-containing protein n=1 Tax=unclassified Methanoculleus TaxID=2619537 RepID=UPI0025DCA25F|nr:MULTISPECIES: ATP-binding cassette domain-containing protein [unclassified Methanoculleus]MCK9317207.1 ATP-binding cassette domain-containing protein [Methanoculleus sp.]MDD2255068.1 ATP-binding cassette domain-containing protein [Methanoculleus sp.]MDD2786655.1 ATP-binding cassette domain-containing protein [Methanoculleus sp.]MDD3215459.1 ATP-binding cassette domain-containing protein [Methanoculleus sp.]MDD4315402.1 ATP-binding cassette domain-containing protein [Methanoculleus sp.]